MVGSGKLSIFLGDFGVDFESITRKDKSSASDFWFLGLKLGFVQLDACCSTSEENVDDSSRMVGGCASVDEGIVHDASMTKFSHTAIEMI